MGFWATAMDGIVGSMFGGAVTAGAVYATIKFERRSRADALESERRSRVEALEFERRSRTKTATTLAVTDLHRDAWDLLRAIDANPDPEHYSPSQGVGTTYSVVLAHATEVWPYFANRIRSNISAMFVLNGELVRSDANLDRDDAMARIRRIVADIAELCRAWLEQPDEFEARLEADPDYLRGSVDDPPAPGPIPG
jgi:hypothetical protein